MHLTLDKEDSTDTAYKKAVEDLDLKLQDKRLSLLSLPDLTNSLRDRSSSGESVYTLKSYH